MYSGPPPRHHSTVIESVGHALKTSISAVHKVRPNVQGLVIWEKALGSAWRAWGDGTYLVYVVLK